jgi:hypothetical protein
MKMQVVSCRLQPKPFPDVHDNGLLRSVFVNEPLPEHLD